MTISTVLSIGLSGLQSSQNAMRVFSQNIANANTPGYVRTEVALAPAHTLSGSSGVQVSAVQRAADKFLATASFIAEGLRGSSAVRADILARAQSNFGDPNTASTMFGNLDSFWSALSALSVDPSSTLRRDDAVSALQATYDEVLRVGESVQSLIAESDQRISDVVEETQSLIDRIAALNKEIQLTKNSGADSSAAENTQSALVDKLASLVDVRVTAQAEGGVHVRTSGGALLVGINPARLSYTPNSSNFATHGVITINETSGVTSNLEPLLHGGELHGLLQVRDVDLAGLAEALGGFAGSLADALNEVHNENASSPAVGDMSGRQTGLLGADSLNFSGAAVIGVSSALGNLTQRLTVDFDAGTITAEPPGSGPFNIGVTIDSFIAALNTALGEGLPPGSAAFDDGVMSLSMTANAGFVIQQDEANPSDRAGRGFSHFFGLNDLVSRPTPLFFESGLNSSDAHGFSVGGDIVLRVRDSAGRLAAERTVSITPALASGSWDDLLAELNATGTGVGEYGAFSMNATTGQITFAPAAGFNTELVQDSTNRGGTRISFSSLHGLSTAATAGRAMESSVKFDVLSDPGRLAVGRPDISIPLGERIIESGDNRGAAALVAARDTTRSFASAGSMSAQSTSLALYAARLGGEAGRMASDAQRAANGAEAVSTAAFDRRTQLEGVSIDDELIKMTAFQNSYAAAARVIQAATEMFDVLMTLGVR